MDIEFQKTQPKWLPLFKQNPKIDLGQLYTQRVTLQNNFTNHLQNSHYQIVLTLIRQVLILSTVNHQEIQTVAALELTFDLKFQVIHQTAGNIFSKKVGIKLYQDNEKYFQFYTHQPYVLQAWIYCLSKKLNQKGFHEMFKPLKKLGKGNFASVYEVQRIADGARFAVKAFSKQNCFSAKNGKQSLINELTIMRQLSYDQHPNILKLQGVYQSQNSIYVVLELLTGGQLFHKIQQSNGYFTPEQIKQFMFGLLSGMKKMHKNRIIHRDLKPQNIMLRSHGSMSPVIVDFGLATPADIDKYLFFRCGTPGYVAPEIIELSQSKHIEPECDIFSAGVIFHILLTRKALFEGSKYQQVYKKNKEMKINLEGQKYEAIDKDALNLLKGMLVVDPTKRITAQYAITHPYFNNFLNQQIVKSPSPTEIPIKRNLVNLKY